VTRHQALFAPQGADTARDVIKLVVMAVGGQGGGVLTKWIEWVARSEGHAVQATSVAGVAQRTGATIYYLEIAPKGVAAPVFALAPAAGDVDILIAAEMMEAGRAIQRGFVTPDRTVLVASTHRSLAVSEKTVPGDGIGDADSVMAAADIAAHRFIAADFERVAIENGSVISASLLGGLAGAGALPFPVARFEEAIRAAGKAVENSLSAFAAGVAAAKSTGIKAPASPVVQTGPTAATGPEEQVAQWAALIRRVAALPAPVQKMAQAGLRKVVDFQDAAYGTEYLDRLEGMASLEDPGTGYTLSIEAAKYIANAMAYDDVIRVADRKTRAARVMRIDGEMGKRDSQVLQLTEYFHPRAEEIAGLLPSRFGARIEKSARWMARLDRWFSRGRRIRTDRISGFLPLYFFAGLRGYRRRTRRHAVELAHLESWLEQVRRYGATDYALAVEVLRCRRLIKGYSDTHVRGLSKFDRVLGGVDEIAGRDDAADWARRLREAALQDEDGAALDGALATIRSFTAVQDRS
jgi:indolepyruvate ferredoxin oxidoreductase beta subunit